MLSIIHDLVITDSCCIIQISNMNFRPIYTCILVYWKSIDDGEKNPII